MFGMAYIRSSRGVACKKDNFYSVDFLLNKHTANTFTFTRHLFLLFLLNMDTHKFKVFANIVYPVQIITSEVTNRCFCFVLFLTKINK